VGLSAKRRRAVKVISPKRRQRIAPPGILSLPKVLAAMVSIL
jgi:hypothetical protein